MHLLLHCKRTINKTKNRPFVYFSLLLPNNNVIGKDGFFMNENNENRFDQEKNEENCKYPEKVQKELIENNESIYAFNWQPTQEKKASSKSAKRNQTWIQTLIISISFLLAFSILCITLIQEKSANVINLTPSPSDTKAQANTDSQKTIYIREYDEKSGALTPQEIYSNSLSSVVSIKASNDRVEGIGSGFVFDNEGHIVTASHVVYGMTEIKVVYSNGQEISANIVACDDLTDLALLKIENRDILPLEFGESSKLLVGDRLFVIGTPASLDFAGTMSCGNVSYLSRKVPIYNDENGAPKKKMTLIQTTADLNPGNSGGPVFDCYGKVVGIVTMKLGGNFDGISFAIPSEGAYDILCDMRDGIELTNEKRAAVATHAAKMGVKVEKYSDGTRVGVLIKEFYTKESDAAKKLKIGDIILSVNGSPVLDAQNLSEIINQYIPSDTVSVTVWRSGQLLTFSIILGS